MNQSQPNVDNPSVQGVVLSTGVSYVVGDYLEGEDEQIAEVHVGTNQDNGRLLIWVRVEGYQQYIEHSGDFTVIF